MNQSFEKIVEQIKNGTIKFHNSHTTFDEYIPDNINQLIYIITKDYIINLLMDLNSFNISFDFKTKAGYVSIGKTIDDELKATGICFDIFANRVSSCLIDIDFPIYDENTCFETYINNLLDYIDSEIIQQCINFDLNKQYKELYIRYDKDDATRILYKLNGNQQYLKPFAESVKTYRPRK